MIIEFYRDQDRDKLRDDVILAYKFLSNDLKEFVDVPNYEEWHPEQHTNCNDAWKIVELLECFGYPRYDWDTVLYSFYIHDGVDFQGDGLSFPQSVCNCLMKYFEFRKQSSK